MYILFSYIRIGNASFKLNGKNYTLFANNGPNSLHGGSQGFDKRKWNLIAENESSITLQYISADGEEGYPGAVKVEIEFTVTNADELQIKYSANLLTNQSSSPQTIVNLTNHSYFNLSGAHSNDSNKILDHTVSLYILYILLHLTVIFNYSNFCRC